MSLLRPGSLLPQGLGTATPSVPLSKKPGLSQMVTSTCIPAGAEVVPLPLCLLLSDTATVPEGSVCLPGAG